MSCELYISGDSLYSAGSIKDGLTITQPNAPTLNTAYEALTTTDAYTVIGDGKGMSEDSVTYYRVGSNGLNNNTLMGHVAFTPQAGLHSFSSSTVERLDSIDADFQISTFDTLGSVGFADLASEALTLVEWLTY